LGLCNKLLSPRTFDFIILRNGSERWMKFERNDPKRTVSEAAYPFTGSFATETVTWNLELRALWGVPVVQSSLKSAVRELAECNWDLMQIQDKNDNELAEWDEKCTQNCSRKPERKILKYRWADNITVFF
jgi:hypothetical protein